MIIAAHGKMCQSYLSCISSDYDALASRRLSSLKSQHPISGECEHYCQAKMEEANAFCKQRDLIDVSPEGTVRSIEVEY